LASKPLQDSGQSVKTTTRPFNAELDIVDGRDLPHPYLAEGLPELNSPSWRVFPDGRMETTHRLRPNLLWHDGAPLSASDFVFAWRVYGAPELGQSGSRPQNLMEEVLAPDPRTVVIRWRAPYPDAGALKDEFQPLPRHMLEQPFAQESPEVFAGLPYWSVEYVGAGPFRLERWEPGAFVEGVAFDAHALGRPRIDRLVIRFFSDENTALTNVLAETVHLAADRALRYEHAQVLKREWTSGKGVILPTPSNVRYVLSQSRPELANPPSVLDVRTRRAFFHSIDKQALSDGLFDGDAILTDRFLGPDVPYAAEIERAIARYPYDARRTEQLMGEVGFARDRDGYFASPAGERFNAVIWQLAGPQYEKELNILVDTWRRAGFDLQTFFLAPTQLRDGRLRASYPAWVITQGGGSTEATLDFLTTNLTPTPANRYSGNNRGGWVSLEYDRLWHAFNTTLDRAERNRQVGQMLRILSEELPALPLYFNLAPTAYLASLKGPEMPARIPDPLVTWNIHEWELR
jgi:peptide/nickel transport system substrate-binding protein